MKKSIMKFCVAGFACTTLLTSSIVYMNAASVTKEEPVAGIALSLDHYYDIALRLNQDSVAGINALTATADITDILDDSTSKARTISGPENDIQEIENEATNPEEVNTEDSTDTEENKYENIGIANVENHLNIREKPGEDQKIIGKLPKDAGCYIYEIDDNGWAKIKSGKVTGYVLSTFLVMGDEVPALAKKVGTKTATVTTETLFVREKPNTECTILTLVPMDEELEVVNVDGDWVEVMVDNDKGFVSKEYVKISYELKKAVYNEDLAVDEASGVTSTRASMVQYAKQFLGNRYVWGGTSLTNGTDCSGFTMSIYSHFGYSISRTSGAQAGNGRTISTSSARPGDLVFYSNGSRINHVAMYIGGGQVIHASNPRSGIKISNMYYRTPVKAVRIIND